MRLEPSRLVDEVPGLLRYARTLTRSDDAAEDLVQSAVVRALERSSSYRGDAALSTWLHRILHNLAVDEARRRREVTAGDLLEIDDGGAIETLWSDDRYTVDAAAVAARTETRAELQDALARLPFIYRSAVLLHDVEGRTAAEIAEIHGIGLPAAKQRLRRGRMMLVSTLALGAGRRLQLRGVPMRCWDARARVSDYLDDDLPLALRQQLEQHLRVCPTCPPLYAGLAGVQSALGAWRDPDAVVPPDLARRIRAALD